MQPVVGMTCKCGRTVSAPCPTLGDLQAALASIKGWQLDDRGRVRCPSCADAPPRAADQAELF